MTKVRIALLYTLVALSADFLLQHASAQTPRVATVTSMQPVVLDDHGDTWTLDNGIVKMTIQKRDGNLASLVYRGVEILTDQHHSYWEQRPAGTVTARITIDPKANGGERAEVAVKGINPSKPASAGDDPLRGRTSRIAPPGGRGGMDLETRFTLERGVSGFYTYTQYTHQAAYLRAGEGESRFILQDMNPTFDWLSVDKDRNQLMPIDVPENHMIHAKEQSVYDSGIYKNSVEHKYSYNAPMYQLQAWGWSSTKDHIGVFFINPSNEYIMGGPERLDLIDHLSAPGSPGYKAIVLDYWTSGHYAGGASNNIPAGQAWTHVVGPIFVYFNSLEHPAEPSRKELDKLHATYGTGMPAVPPEWNQNALALWNDAVAKSKEVKLQWPYDWVEGMDYPHKAERGAVSGRLVLNDPQAKSKLLPNLNVGLTHVNYTAETSPRAGNGNIVTWPHDGENYQFWVVGAPDGHFAIPNVRPGTYAVRAFANGVLGEYDMPGTITVEPGKSVDLGKLAWKPVRYGRQVWEIGYPDRTGDKFFKGDGANYWLWGWGLRYPGLFPNDITYTIGKSDYHKDWFFEEVPHSSTTAWLNTAAKDPYNQRFGWVTIPPDGVDPWPEWGKGRATTWTVNFHMTSASRGRAILRVALAGADGGNGTNPSAPGGLIIGVNGQTVGTIHPVATNALRYNTNKGVWNQYVQVFDATCLKRGANTMTFTVPAGDVTTGVVWDYLRLELNDSRSTFPNPPDAARPDAPSVP